MLHEFRINRETERTEFILPSIHINFIYSDTKIVKVTYKWNSYKIPNYRSAVGTFHPSNSRTPRCFLSIVSTLGSDPQFKFSGKRIDDRVRRRETDVCILKHFTFSYLSLPYNNSLKSWKDKGRKWRHVESRRVGNKIVSIKPHSSSGNHSYLFICIHI